MAYLTSHGGYCCGIRHLISFTSADTKKQYEFEVKKAIARGYLIEAVLNECQMFRYENQVKWLKELGFREVTSFCNGNSGNICTVFHYHPNPTFHNVDISSLPKRSAFWLRIRNFWNSL